MVLEWDPISLATADLRCLSLYRNGSKAGNIPRDKLSTKISGLAIDTEYTFHLVLRTSAGTYSSEKLTVKTQKMTDLTGITITAGVMPAALRDSLAETVQRISAKLIDTVRIDTTHFVCTEGRGQAWEKAVEMNVPVVVPDWVKGCEREGRIVGVRGYYLNADPKTRTVGPGTMDPGTGNSSSNTPGSAQIPREQALRVAPVRESPRIEHTPPTPEQTRQRDVSSNGISRFANDDGNAVPPTPPPKMEAFPPAPTEMDEDYDNEDDEVRGDGGHVPLAQDSAAADAVDEEKERDGDESDDTEKEPEAEENSLKKVGIPHRSAPDAVDTEATTTKKKVGAGQEEEEGNFDEVDL